MTLWWQHVVHPVANTPRLAITQQLLAGRWHWVAHTVLGAAPATRKAVSDGVSDHMHGCVGDPSPGQAPVCLAQPLSRQHGEAGSAAPNMVPALGKLGEPVSSVTQMWGAGKHARETSLLLPERKPG